MLRKMALCAVAACAVLTGSTAAADDHGDRDHADRDGRGGSSRHETLKVAVWGDQFYAADPAQKEAMKQQTIASMNAHRVDFTLYAGDTKNGSSPCTDQAIGQDVLDAFNQLRAPTLYSLGDNEWTDCHRTSNDSYDPLERLAYLRQVFFSKPVSQGRHPIKVQRQGLLGQEYSENSRFVRSNVAFVALHVPGSNNNLVATDKQCYNKSNRTAADCAAATAEYQARNVQNIAWLKEAFARARAKRYAGIVLVIQADIFFPFELSDGGYAEDFLPSLDPAVNGYADFFHTLVEETQSYQGQVLLIHGDSHYFKIDKAMYDLDGNGETTRVTANFTRVEGFGETDNSWVEMTVDPDSENVFSFRPVILR
ncbi:MAG: hypothetical protein R3E86_00380 [Pseudomonadales bacterium]